MACVESFPEINRFYKQYKDQVDIVLVGLEGGRIREIYARYMNQMKLELPYAFDSTIFRSLGIHFVPRMIWIDSTGNVQAVGTSTDMTSSNMDAFFKGRPLKLQKLFGGNESNFDYHKPLLVNGNGGPDSAFLFRSILTGFNPEALSISPACIQQKYCLNQIMAGNSSLFELYDLAYNDTLLHYPDPIRENNYGEYWSRPLLELKDSSLFNCDFSTGRNLYCYNTTVPIEKVTTKLLRNTMQEDLSHYFGYRVSIERRLMPCWNLVASPLARLRLKSKGAKSYMPGARESAAGFTMTNAPLSALIAIIWPYHQSEPPILDKTAIAGNIDLTMSCIMSNWQDVEAELNRHGLNLVPGKALMNVIVIRDR
jgi:hypothetical protein